MSTTPDNGHEDDLRSAASSPTPDEEVASVEAPDDERSRLATHPDPTIAAAAEDAARVGRSRVELVRLPELATRGATHTLAAGQQLNRQFVDVIKTTVREERVQLRQRLAARSAAVAVTGPEHAQTRAPGREGVSR